MARFLPQLRSDGLIYRSYSSIRRQSLGATSRWAKIAPTGTTFGLYTGARVVGLGPTIAQVSDQRIGVVR